MLVFDFGVDGVYDEVIKGVFVILYIVYVMNVVFDFNEVIMLLVNSIILVMRVVM